MKRRNRWVLSMVLVCALIISVCSGSGGGAQTQKADEPQTADTAAVPEEVTAAKGNDAYEVTEPVTIEFWHTLEEMYRDDFNELVDEFEKENPNITVNVSYQGRVGEILEKILAANIAGDGLPDVFPIHSSEIQVLAENGVVENLDPYIAGNGTDVSKISMSDVYARDGSQYGLTWTITGMCWFYNQTIADQEGIQLPKTWDEMDGFLRKAAIINADGTTERYGMWIGGWDSYYFTWMLWNNGVLVIDEDGNTTINSEKAQQTVAQIKQWIDEGLMMWGYGSNGSTNMRQAFWDGQVFAIVHTSSQYMNHYDNMKQKGYELGAYFPPAGSDQDTTEVFGMCLSIPTKSDANKKAAAYKLIEYLTSEDVNLKMAEFTGFLANGTDVMASENGQEYLEENPAMKNIYERIGDMTVAIQLPCYPEVTDVLEDGLALIFLENHDVKEQLDEMAYQITDLYANQ